MKKSIFFLLLFILSFYACEEGGLLIETDITNSQVILLAPGDGVEVSSNSILFDWEPVEDATSYEIQVATPDFDNTQQFLLNATDSVTFKELELTIGDYQWRVRAKNSGYETPYSAASFKVIPVENFSDNNVLLIAPQNNLVTNSLDQNLEWQSIAGATLYRIQILENGSIIDERTVTEDNFNISFTEGSLIWQVRAENGTDNTLYAARDILIDVTNPNVPTLTLPENNTTLTSQDVSFEWSRELVEGSVEFDSIYVYRDINLTDLVIKDQGASPFTSTLENNTYFWLVKGFDEAGNQSNDSDIFSFIVNE